MRNARLLVALAILAAFPFTADAEGRSKAVRAEFQRIHPCPSTGQTQGACPGFVADHSTPLCAGGADAASNLQWQTIEEAKAKDRIERASCRRQK